VYDLGGDNISNSGYENEDLIVWMRTAALPTFRKLYRRVSHVDATFRDGLPAGNYTLNVGYGMWLMTGNCILNVGYGMCFNWQLPECLNGVHHIINKYS